MPVNPPPRRLSLPYPTACLAFDERVWRSLPPQRGSTVEQVAQHLQVSASHAEAALVRLQCASPEHARIGGGGRWYRLGDQFCPTAVRLVFGPRTAGEDGVAEISISSGADAADEARPRHLLSMPGREPIEVDVVDDGAIAAGAPCPACGALVGDLGDILHSPGCAVAREAAADASRDITTDGSAVFASAAQLRLAREFAAEQLGSEATYGEPPATAERRRDLVVGYIAGSRHAAQEIAEIVQTGAARLVEDVDTWIRGASVPGEAPPGKPTPGSP